MKAFTTPVSWFEAKHQCNAAFGGHLISIHSPEFNQRVSFFFFHLITFFIDHIITELYSTEYKIKNFDIRNNQKKKIDRFSNRG